MRIVPFALALAALFPAGAASAQADMPGRYRLAEGPDVAGELLLTADGRFRYALAAGALDERAEGSWRQVEGRACLFTEPTPKPPEFAKAPLVAMTDPDDVRTVPTLLVTWPDGTGVAGIDFRIGFDRGEPIESYVQEYGWTLPEDERRRPLWAEFSESMFGIAPRRFDLAENDGGKLHVTLIPNDIGVVDFAGACLEPVGERVILHRREGTMRFVRAKD